MRQGQSKAPGHWNLFGFRAKKRLLGHCLFPLTLTEKQGRHLSCVSSAASDPLEAAPEDGHSLDWTR